MWWLVGFAAFAQDAITYEARTQVAEGEPVAITFRARVSGTVAVTLQCGGRASRFREEVAPGWSKTVSIEGLKVGEGRCEGTLRLDEPDGAWGEMPLSVPFGVWAPIDWAYTLADVDLAGKRLVAHPSRPLRTASLEVIGAGGARIETVSGDLVDPRKPSFSWTRADEVLALRITGEDANGIRGFLELSPWSYAVPHEDVNFASGQHDIPPAEVVKLEQTWAEVQAVLERYGDVVAIELFVAGYTDTVGAAASNQALSERRARSIAAWFRQRGFTRPIWYQGFGEDALAVQTPDETDAAANRRALYVLSASPPPVGPAVPRDAWRRL